MKDQNIEETVKCIDNKECGKVARKGVCGQAKGKPQFSDQEGKYT